MIGSSSRDFLLERKIYDYDFVTDATPSEMLEFIKNADATFSKFGVIKTFYNDEKIDLVTLREEKDYKDYRHPKYVKFVKDINIDYLRRDFTINAIYINEKYEVEKVSLEGFQDLKNGILRFIGDPNQRINEDPLRILRAKRFILEYNLETDDMTLEALEKNEFLISKLNKSKVDEEMKKMEGVKKRL